MSTTTTTWQELVTDKKRRQTEAIPKSWLISTPPPSELIVTGVPEACGLLTEKEVLITNTEVVLLLEKLASAEWSSVEVTTAFYKRAIVAQQLVNCLTEIFVDRALARARELDDHLKLTGKVIGPLHGLPISLKDQLRIKGLETTMALTGLVSPGYVSWIGKYAEKNSVLVDILYECGANPFVQTNVPQTLMWPETFNNVFGRTANPHNRSLTSGGSSGGEGALVALRGSPIGIGSDIGGSIRIPAAFNGLYGLRPSYGRVPYAGAVNSMEGQDSVPSVFGPICNSIGGVKTLMKAIIDSKPWLKDPLAVRKKWDEEDYSLAEHGHGKNLVFGIVWNNGHTVPHPPIIRALEMTKAALEAAGHKVIDWLPHRDKELCDTVYAIWNAGCMQDFNSVTSLTGEPLIDNMLLEAASSEAVVAGFRPPLNSGATAFELWQLQKTKLKLRQEYLDLWQETSKMAGTGRPIDAIISPVAPFTATPHGLNKDASYTSIFNALDYPSFVFPVTRVDPVKDGKKPPHQFLSPEDEANYSIYDPETFLNAPVSLQLSGRTLEEEAVIAMTEIVDVALKTQK
ncbi:general amidase [Cristinia sonorae]|uniref:amidase n=1 Tax=Cristinia sonorae TaxID=1940300 RepID=A0A8K0XRC6_9AGAR|nr:general amidase [Cristinia sonorae]